ncbi:uncharacterized protein LOC144704110 [Wolffia australiana]
MALAAALAAPPLQGRRIAFTSPPVYGARLAALVELRGGEALPVPSIVVEPTPATIAALRGHLGGGAASFSVVAFTSRVGISAFSAALAGDPPPGNSAGGPLTVCALGKDAELLYEGELLSLLRRGGRRVDVLVPETASPDGLVAALRPGRGRRVLCPVPAVIGLAEPAVVPEFLRGLAARGWAPERVGAYETRWAGEGCAAALMAAAWPPDALVFTSTAEVEGLVKALAAAGRRWRAVRERWPGMVVAAHGPVTAGGAAALGVEVDVVSSSFGCFDGVLDAIAHAL